MGKSKRAAVCSVMLVCWFGTVAADPFVGRFVGEFNGEEYRLALRSTGNEQYEGVIAIGGEDVPLIALRQGDRLSGQVGIGGDSFDFSAEFHGGVLLLRDNNGEVIRLDRE